MSTSQSRYADLDSDESRLPEGMQRVGYDADTQTYTFRDSDGSIWESEEGNRYGTLHRVGQSEDTDRLLNSVSGVTGQVHRPPTTTHSPRSRLADYRYFAPFAVIVCVVLLLLFRLLDYSPRPEPLACEDGQEEYEVVGGDSCWAIAESHGMSVGQLEDVNSRLNCDKLQAGQRICVVSLEETQI